jgi:hypothetical protein
MYQYMLKFKKRKSVVGGQMRLILFLLTEVLQSTSGDTCSMHARSTALRKYCSVQAEDLLPTLSLCLAFLP